MRCRMTTLLSLISTTTTLAADPPRPDPLTPRPTPSVAAPAVPPPTAPAATPDQPAGPTAEATAVAPRVPTPGKAPVGPKGRGRAVHRRLTPAELARDRALLESAVQAQQQQFFQDEADGRAAALAEQQGSRNRQARTFDTIRRLTPQGVTVTRVGNDGSYDTNTFFVFPNPYPYPYAPGLPFQP